MIYRHRRSDVHQEEDIIPWRKVLLLFFGCFAVGGVLAAWAGYALDSREAVLRPSRFFPEKTLGPRREMMSIEQDLFGERGSGQILNEQKAKSLQRFEWVDRDRRVVSVPIDQAMDLVIEESRK